MTESEIPFELNREEINMPEESPDFFRKVRQIEEMYCPECGYDRAIVDRVFDSTKHKGTGKWEYKDIWSIGVSVCKNCENSRRGALNED